MDSGADGRISAVQTDTSCNMGQAAQLLQMQRLLLFLRRIQQFLGSDVCFALLSSQCY